MPTIHTYTERVRDEKGRLYTARAEGELQADGKWFGHFVFEPVDAGPALRTERETTQSSLEDLEYWASGIEPVYLEGALERARVLP